MSSNETSSKKIRFGLSAKILCLVLVPVLLLSITLFISELINAQSRNQAVLDGKRTSDSMQAQADTSSKMNAALLQVKDSLTNLDEGIRSDHVLKVIDEKRQVSDRQVLRGAIRTYYSSIISFTSSLENNDISSPELSQNLTGLVRLAGQLDRIASLYEVANSRSVRLARDVNIGAAQNNYTFEERSLFKAINKTLLKTTENFDRIGAIVSSLQASRFEERKRRSEAQIRQTNLLKLVVISGIILILTAVALFITRRQIVQPIRNIPNLILNLEALDDETREIRNDEIGEVLTAVDTLRAKTHERRQVEETEKLAEESKREAEKSQREREYLFKITI